MSVGSRLRRRRLGAVGLGLSLACAPGAVLAQQACGTSTSDQFTVFTLGSTPGIVSVTYDMFGIPDALDVFYGDELVASTGGFVSDSDGAPLTFSYAPVGGDFTVLTSISPSDSFGSAWIVTVGCPGIGGEGVLAPEDQIATTAIVTAQAASVQQIGRTQTLNFTRRLENLRHGGGSGRVSVSGLALSYNGRVFTPDFGGGFSERLASGLASLASRGPEGQPGSGDLGGGDLSAQRVGSPLLERMLARFDQARSMQDNWRASGFQARLAGEQSAQATDGGIELPDRLGVFVNGIVNVGDRNATSDASGFDFRNLGISFGADYRITADFLLGAGFGINLGRTDIAGGSKSDVDGYNLTAYGSWRPLDAVYVDGILSYSILDFDLERAIAGSTARALGDRTGHSLSASLTGGYEFYSQSFTYGPYVRLGYGHTSLDAFTERGTSALAYDNENLKTLTTTVGFRGDYAISTSSGILLPHVRAEYEHEFKGDNNPAIIRFAGVPGSETALAPAPVDRNYFNVGGGLSFLMENAVSLFVDYESLLGFSNQSSHLITAGVTARF